MTQATERWRYRRSWRSYFVNPIFPPGDEAKGSRPLAIRFPSDLIRRIDQVARETHNTRSAIILHSVRWALDEYARQRDAEDARASRVSAEKP